MARKAKAGVVHSVSRCMQGVQVKIPECLIGVITTRRYTNPRLPLPYLVLALVFVFFCITCILLVVVNLVVSVIATDRPKTPLSKVMYYFSSAILNSVYLFIRAVF